MVRFQISPESATRVEDYLFTLRGRILLAIREQMAVEMVALADQVITKLHGDPINSHTGRLEARVLASPRVTETTGAVRGSVDAQDGNLNLGLWLEKGHRFPKMRQKLLEKSNPRNILKRLSSERLEELRSQGGRVKAYPFLIPALQEREPAIFANIRQKVADAIEGV